MKATKVPNMCNRWVVITCNIHPPLTKTTMAFEIKKPTDGRVRQKLQTRDGREVQDWWFISRADRTFFPIRAIIKLSDGTTEEHPYTRGGRRYINVESPLDLVPAPRERKRVEGLDCMPDMLKAIRCVRNKDMSGVRSANKDNVPYHGPSYADDAPVEIGGTL